MVIKKLIYTEGKGSQSLHKFLKTYHNSQWPNSRPDNYFCIWTCLNSHRKTTGYFQIRTSHDEGKFLRDYLINVTNHLFIFISLKWTKWTETCVKWHKNIGTIEMNLCDILLWTGLCLLHKHLLRDVLQNRCFSNIKAYVHYSDQICISHQMIALQKLWKMFFISSKKLFAFSRYSNFCISVFPSFSPCQPLLKRLIEDKS